MQFPLYYLLIPYIFFLVVWGAFSAIALFHMLSYGFKNCLTIGTILAYLAVSAMMLIASYSYIAGIDWTAQAEVGMPAPATEVFFAP